MAESTKLKHSMSSHFGESREQLLEKLRMANSRCAKLEEHLEYVMLHGVHYAEKKAASLRDDLTEMRDRFATLQRRHDKLHVELKESGGMKGATQRGGKREKVFVAQESMLIEMLREPHVRTIYHIFVAALILFLGSILMDEYIVKGTVHRFTMIIWAFGNITTVVRVWLIMFLHSFVPCLAFNLHRKGTLPKPLFWAVYLLCQVANFCWPAYEVWRNKLPTASALIVMCESARLLMKMHSFVCESMKLARAMTHPKRTKLDVNSRLLKTPNERIAAFNYFLWAPTLIYRNQYPRTPCVRWSWALNRFAETVFSVLYTYVIFQRFCVDMFESTARNPGSLKNFFASCFSSTLPGTGVFLLGFFAVLHGWFNCWAEITRFADRKFYLDWWNVTSFAQYYRKWNIVVHDWLYQYLFLDLQALGCNYLGAQLLTFTISALVHEWILSCSLHFFYPVLLFLFLGLGVAFIYMAKALGVKHLRWNIAFWAALLFGNGLMMALYSREWYARQWRQMRLDVGYAYNEDTWVPYSLQPFWPHL